MQPWLCGLQQPNEISCLPEQVPTRCPPLPCAAASCSGEPPTARRARAQPLPPCPLPNLSRCGAGGKRVKGPVQLHSPAIFLPSGVSRRTEEGRQREKNRRKDASFVSLANSPSNLLGRANMQYTGHFHCISRGPVVGSKREEGSSPPLPPQATGSQAEWSVLGLGLPDTPLAREGSSSAPQPQSSWSRCLLALPPTPPQGSFQGL